MHHNKHIPHNYLFERSIPPRAHFKQSSSSLTHHNNNSNSQNIMMDAVSPSLIGETNVRFVTTHEREVRDRQVTQALNMISQSVEPPEHNVDRFKDWVLEFLYDENVSESKQHTYYFVAKYILGWPLWIARQIWNYVILQIHLAYNLTLLYASFFITPRIAFFVIGFTMFWVKIIYELYRDIMHRDDPVYNSNIPREMSFAAAISASFGFVLKVKAETGDISDAWWRNEE
ncbi:hypothetical protein C6P42_004701 [Pichia californica]|nr:hypothetical protein C6P42_004701 [[Candida] californica]